MNAPLPRPPASLTPAELDARILQAEMQLIARQEHLRRGGAAFSHQLRESLQPRRLIQPAVMTAAVAVILLWWPPRKAAPPQQQPAAGVAAAAARPALAVLLAGIPWTRLLSHAWPLLPGHWRERLNPATAANMLTLGLPLFEGWLNRRRHKDEPARPG